jgi:hypothetical protein
MTELGYLIAGLIIGIDGKDTASITRKSVISERLSTASRMLFVSRFSFNFYIV